MPQRLGDYRVFWREFRGNFRSTGAVLPSGPSLAQALARFVGKHDRPRRILEVGPGTGAVTRAIVAALGAEDRLDLVELNEQFVLALRRRFDVDPAFRAVSERTRVLHRSVESLEEEAPYDVIVSGLPLNNFSATEVENILRIFRRLLRAGGVLSFFEYIAIRSFRAMISPRAERIRLQGIGQALDDLLKPHEIRREWILPNIPPAWVHHVRLPPQGGGGN
jgi:phosphatidylethanolamine/phosphatidyl-N-methylethanolamine N-methyltransferase